MQTEKGLIMKSTAGFYYVRCDDGKIIECRARGVFRKQKVSPLVGDKVVIEHDGEKGTVVEICDRKNYLIRPPVANLDKLVIVSSVVEPVPSLLILDKLTAMAVNKDIEPVVVFSKADLENADQYVDIYRKAGIESFAFSSKTGEGAEEIRNVFNNSVCALTGNTGVGKSSLLNCIAPELELATSHISDKLGRGRHTTRTVELYELFGGYIADTPGFSSLDFENSEIIIKENLPFCFPEFEEYIGQCKFVSCAHIGEKGCAVCAAAKEGRIPDSRLESYKMMYDEVKDYKEWQNK
ncbi:MAG: ribosome small subunit-dependent GTPase A [Clostridia bacterium]|nr:ribosome small subunit-dependent GTPase A [Clostridia bacterium]